jgi:2-Cys peroxiredoxin 5
VKGIFVIAVNDAFVTGAWEKQLASDNSTNPGIRVLSDASGDFARAWDVEFDASKFFGNNRSKRYAAVVENGTVVDAFVEPDGTGISVSSADSILGTL